MILYSYRFKPLGKLTKVPDSQSFFGSLCYSYGKEYGEKELVEMLERSHQGNPDFLLSSFFVHNFLPTPYDLNIPIDKNIGKNSIVLSQLKKYKKIKFFSKIIFKEYQKDSEKFSSEYNSNLISGKYITLGSDYLIMKEETNDYNYPFYIAEMETRNLVGEEKQLFYSQVNYYDFDLTFDVYFKFNSEESHQKILRVLKKMLYVSIGGNKSIGHNLFSYQEEQMEKFNNQNKNKVLLSKSTGASSIDYDNSYYQLINLNSKFNYALETTFKKSALVFKEGSSFRTNQEIIGEILLESVNGENKYTNLLGFLI